MERILPTRARTQKRIREWSSWGAAALVGGGVALSLSIIFAGPGVAMIVVGILVGLLGWGVAALVGFGLPYKEYQCPTCQSVSAVLPWPKAYQCDGCGAVMAVEAAWPVPPLRVREAYAYVLARRMLIVFTALSYVAFFVEVYLGHYAEIQGLVKSFTWNYQLVPVIFSPLALLGSLAAAFRLNPGPVRLFRIMMWASILVGLAGTYFHLSSRVLQPSVLLTVEGWLGDPPALAPFAFTLPGIMGLVATFGLEWTRGEPPAEEEIPERLRRPLLDLRLLRR